MSVSHFTCALNAGGLRKNRVKASSLEQSEGDRKEVNERSQCYFHNGSIEKNAEKVRILKARGRAERHKVLEIDPGSPLKADPPCRMARDHMGRLPTSC